MAHGKNQSINVTNIDGDANNQLTSTGDGRTNKSNTHATNIQDLGVPEGNINNATLYLYTCHSADTRPDAHGEQGALTGSKQTVSQSFSQNYDFRFVVSTTGSVNYYGINSSLGLIWLSLLPTIMLFWLRCKIINKWNLLNIIYDKKHLAVDLEIIMFVKYNHITDVKITTVDDNSRYDKLWP